MAVSLGTRETRVAPVALLAEPAGHVKKTEFDLELAAAADAGLPVVDRPNVSGSYAAVLQKG